MDQLHWWDDEEPKRYSREWQLLDTHTLVRSQRWAVSAENVNNETWWDYYKRYVQARNKEFIQLVERDPEIREFLDERWGNHFMYNGWSMVSHHAQLKKEREAGNIDW